MDKYASYFEYLDLQIGQNTLGKFLLAFGVFLLIWLVSRLFRLVIINKLDVLSKMTKSKVDDFFVECLKNVPGFFYVILALFISLKFLFVPDPVERFVKLIFLVVLVFQSIKIIEKIVLFSFEKYFEISGEGEGNETIIHGISLIVKIVLWSIGALLILSNVGININSLIASMGIGGIAVALAVQNILGDIFSSFSLYFDRPFKIGDYIVIDSYSGTVNKIGLKTTRLTTLQGEELVLSNKELTSARLQNFKKMKKRRVSFQFGIVYETKLALIKKVPLIVKDIFEKIDAIELIRVNFFQFGDSSLNFEVAYYVNEGDYALYMDKQEKINIAILEEFEKDGIEMAYPTSTIYLKKTGLVD